MEELSCQVCGGAVYQSTRSRDELLDVPLCIACQERYPAALIKATWDHFDYALGLRNGMVLRFEQARIAGAWLHLRGVSEWTSGENNLRVQTGYSFDRGIDIRLDDVLWVADAPQGS